MGTSLSDHSAGLFPPSDQFSLGGPGDHVSDVVEPVSGRRPFGLRLAVPLPAAARVRLDEVGYDEDRQQGVVRTATGLVPLSKHTTGQTATITDGGDGHGSNRDSDTDHRED